MERDLFEMSKPRPRIFSAIPRMNFQRAGIVDIEEREC